MVLSNADPVRTAGLAGAEPPPGWRQAGPVVKVMVLLDGLPDFPSWPGAEPWQGAIDIGFTLGDLTAAADDARAGRPAAAPWIEAACQTATDDSLAPPGRHVLSMFCQCFPADVDAEAAADTAIARFAEVCPDLPARVQSTGSRSGRASSRRASASPAATSSTARCCPGSCSRTGPTGAASAGWRRSTWRAPAPIRAGR